MTTASGRKLAKPKPRAERVIATPGVCAGQWRIAGTRIPVSTLVRMRSLGASNEQLLEDYPSLSLADLAAAWKFAKDYPDHLPKDD